MDLKLMASLLKKDLDNKTKKEISKQIKKLSVSDTVRLISLL